MKHGQNEAAKATIETANEPMTNRWNNRTLFLLMWPLIVEQLLAVTVGLADTVMVSGLGEAAVSGVALVDSINLLLITALSALATGGAVVASQYLGRRDRVSASATARQLVYAVTALSLIIMAVTLLLRKVLLGAIYGSVEADVLANGEMYLWLSALSYPFIALYNAGAAIFRSMGNSRIGMVTALLVNFINIGGNALLIYGFGMGVAGAAISTLVSRAVAAFILLRLLLKIHVGPITLAGLFRFHINKPIIKQILSIGVPNGLENSLFQVGKLIVARLVSTFGTSAIAGNAITWVIISFITLPGQSFGLAMLTVVGQCVGAKNYAAARLNTAKLLKAAYLCMSVLCGVILLLRNPILSIFNLTPEAIQLAKDCLLVFCLTAPLFWPSSFALPNALRAAGDARFTMGVSMFSMWVFRIGSAYLLALFLGLGVIGVWYAMAVDWIVRSAFFILRWRGGRWQQRSLIG